MEKVCAEPRGIKESRLKKMHPVLTTIESLPREVVLNILSRLPITSLIHVKLVCRSWHSLAQDPLLATVHFSRLAKTEETDPCLILHCDLPIQNNLYSLHFSDANIETITRIDMSIISEFTIVGSCNGLLCLWHSLYRDQGYIYNPFTKYYIKLPKPEQLRTQKRVAIRFGFHPTTKEYKVVRIVYYKNLDDEVLGRHSLPDSEVQILTLHPNGERLAWRSKGKTSYQLGMPSESRVLINGRLHWLTYRYTHQSRRMLVSFDLKDEQFRQVSSPNYKRFCIFVSDLLNLRGCLSAVVQGYGSLYIWVMKEYGVEESWIKEFSIVYQSPSRPWQFCGRVLCFVKNGKILLEFKGQSLVCYDPSDGTFEELNFHCLPKCFNAIVHIGSLNRIETPIDL